MQADRRSSSPLLGRRSRRSWTKPPSWSRPKPDVVEWRVDYFQGVGDVQRVVDTARELNEALGEIPILFTFRTKREAAKRRSV